MQYKKFYEVAEIQSGLVLSRKEARFNSKQSIEYMKLNLRSINDDGSIDQESLDKYFALEKLDEQFTTHKNDIVVRLFSPFKPALITESFIGLVIPSQFAIIRLKSNKVIPKFLCCYLSYRNVLSSLAIRESGQISGGIKLSALSEIEIPILTIEKQKAISSYSEIYTKQRKLYLSLIEQYDIKMDTIMNRVIGGK